MAFGKKYNWLAKIIFGAVLVIVEASSSDHGMVPAINGEAIGYDLSALVVYACGLYLLYSGLKDFKARN